MKTIFLTILLSFLMGHITFSQTKFEEGYFINNDGLKSEGLIRNKDWRMSPTEFSFKENEDAEIIQKTIHEVTEFSVDGKLKYIRATVEIDKSSTRIDKLTNDKNPHFETETLFLKVLQEGEASLYDYTTSTLDKYFFKPDDSSKVIQLFFKEYYTPDGRIAQNNAYKQQLFNHLKCGDLSFESFNIIGYNRKDLEKIVLKFNQCVEPGFKEEKITKKNFKDVIRVKLKGGYTQYTLKYHYPNALLRLDEMYLVKGSSFNFGGEIEVVFPFNNNKWSLFLSPVYQSLEATQEGDTPINYFELNYQSIEFPIGVRYYSFLSEKVSLYFDAGYVINHTINGEVVVEKNYYSNTHEINPFGNLNCGLGFNFNKRIDFEIRYGFNRELITDKNYYSLKYSPISFNLAFRIL